MADWAKEHLSRGKTFNKAAPAQWFAEHYPKIKRATVNMPVEGMSVNNRIRKHHPNVKPGSGHDLFYKLGPDQFRLWEPGSDSAPLYKEARPGRRARSPARCGAAVFWPPRSMA
jgi:hypothetical protein